MDNVKAYARGFERQNGKFKSFQKPYNKVLISTTSKYSKVVNKKTGKRLDMLIDRYEQSRSG